MSKPTATIPKKPALKPADDYYRLRREGIGFIEQMGSRLWTDYNTHDSGITILESLCYAMTDLAYRTGWDIRDILTTETSPSDTSQPYPQQAFFTAREILTVNPATPDDFRRLLIDLDRVRNAWVFCKECGCDQGYYAWCEDDQLVLSYRKPQNPSLAYSTVDPLGLYDVLLELESDPDLGDLNDRKIEHRYTVFDADNRAHPVTMELRFPEMELEKWTEWQQFLHIGDTIDVAVKRFGATRTYNLMTPAVDEAGRDAYLRDHWRHIFYVDFEITANGEKVTIENAALRMIGDALVRKETTFLGVKDLLGNNTSEGFIQRYRSKRLKVTQAVAEAKATLHGHRNLDEDYCRIRGVDVEDVAACADVEVAPDADIERVQARIWLEIEQYFNPPVPFYTLQELMDDDAPVEAIFNGPKLNNGFIKTGELEAAGLKTVLRTSDIINRLMDIEGVVAVNNLLLSKYDSEGNIVKGAADPTLHNDTPLFDADKISAAWLLYISPSHQPRLYQNQSRFYFYKNGLPFHPRMDEVDDTLTQLRGEAERPKIKSAPKDLPIPAGQYRNPDDYYPVQYSFPLAYGIGPEGLPFHASSERRAQARQLKAYLMVFEAILGNAFAQLAHTKDLFSLDTTVDRTYFVQEFSKEIIQGYDEITKDLDKAALEALTETTPEFHQRRNRFLNHIMARFGEQFSEYALMLTNLQGQQVALDRLVDDKISFLKIYPAISHDRARAIDYRNNPCSPVNIPGIKKRVSMLLGYPDLAFSAQVTQSSGDQHEVRFQIKGQDETVLIEGALTITAATAETAMSKACGDVLVQMVQGDTYSVVSVASQFRLKLKDKNSNDLGQVPGLFATRAEALAFKDELMGWSSNERAIVVEHLLLRPKFPGDALYPACTDGACRTCGDEDPYSFRLTFVMPGWTAPFNTNLDMRGFAERTILQEIPSHLLGKICWVGNDGFFDTPCDPVISELAQLLITEGLTAEGERPDETEACDCALAIYAVFSAIFTSWYASRTLNYHQAEALNSALKLEFDAEANPAEISCSAVLNTALWAEVQAVMVRHFHHIALFGWQFERFEDAWCQWLRANSPFDWTEERLQERVQAILENNLPDPAALPSQRDALCSCAAAILSTYGEQFHLWMESNVKAGKAFDSFTAFSPAQVGLCGGIPFKPGTAAKITALLNERYHAYKHVSYRLWIVVDLLSKLRNMYPSATLHDCDEGGDKNPVLLGETSLGN